MSDPWPRAEHMLIDMGRPACVGSDVSLTSRKLEA